MNDLRTTPIASTDPTIEERDGFLAYLEDLEQSGEPVDWAVFDAELGELRARDLEIDEAQGEYNDWRWA